MKLAFLFSFFILIGGNDISNSVSLGKTEMAPCPKSPNCVSTQETRRRKRMRPIPFTNDLEYAMEKLERMLAINPRATLIKKENNYFHYEFKTKFGKFIDDVDFFFDEKNKQIHFRSASRKGYGDFGKNKRRMKRIRKDWKKFNPKIGVKY